MAYTPGCTLSLFRDRLVEAGFSTCGLYELDIPEDIDKALTTVLRPPLVFDDVTVPSDSLWWFRGSASDVIRAFESLGSGRYLINSESARDEIKVAKMWVNYSARGNEASFVYVKCLADEPLFISRGEITAQLKWRPIAYEDVLYFPGLDRYETPEVDDSFRATHRSELRSRYVTPYNLFIAPKESRINNTGALGDMLDRLCNDLLTGQVPVETAATVVSQLPTSDYHEYLTRLARGY